MKNSGGDKRRFNLFARLIKNHFNPSTFQSIADIAGGKGYLQVALKDQGYTYVVTFDKRKKEKRAPIRNLNYQYRFFSSNIKEKFDILVGMHPDEATDIIITESIKRNIPFAIVPCCVKPFAVLFKNHNHKYTDWLKHLKNIALKNNYDVEEFQLKMSGRNIAIIGKPKK